MSSLKMQLTLYRLKTALRSLVAIYRLPPEQIDAFMRSYELFNKEIADEGDEKSIVDYYSVLNHLCAIGEVEKMYIPAVIDVTKGIVENQLLFEKKMSRDLNIQAGDHVLDIGCGRGRVAAHIASSTQAHVVGFNIDEVQLNSAKKFASVSKLTDRCRFIKASLNAPFPFPDTTFNALYQIQALTYTQNKEKTFSEMFRVLKPGGKLSFLDWVQLDNYDPKDPHHRELVQQIKPLIGAIDTPTAHEIKNTLEKVGFNVLLSQDASIGGHQADLIERADKFYKRTRKLIDVMVTLRVLPQHFSVLFDRLTKYGDSFVEADRLGIITTSFQTVAQKPISS